MKLDANGRRALVGGAVDAVAGFTEDSGAQLHVGVGVSAELAQGQEERVLLRQ